MTGNGSDHDDHDDTEATNDPAHAADPTRADAGSHAPAADGTERREDGVAADAPPVPAAAEHGPIRVEGVRKSYPAVEALSGVEFTVEPGTFHCLVGPNGSGKTTLFRLLLGLTRPTAGRIERPDVPMGVGFQRANFYPDLTVAENARVFSGLAGGVDPDWRDRLFDVLRLERVTHRTAAELSGGFRKKLDLALALLKRPPVVLLDEPLGDLDDVSKEQLLAFLGRYRDAGHTVVVSTHHVAEFGPLLDRLTILHDGDVVLDEAVPDVDLAGHDSLQELYVSRILDREGVPESAVDFGDGQGPER